MLNMGSILFYDFMFPYDVSVSISSTLLLTGGKAIYCFLTSLIASEHFHMLLPSNLNVNGFAKQNPGT